MRWSERQQAMLREIGVRLWLADAAGATAGATDCVAAPASTQVDPVSRPGATRLPSAIGAGVSVDRSGTALLDWPALAGHAAACTACALCAGRTRSVFGAGQLEADWMIVGDAPDEDDDRAGEPFAGKAGRLLDNMLAAMQLTRGAAPRASRVYLTQAVKCQPPGRRLPEPGEVARCEPFLLRQVQLVQPRIILAMGRTASLSMLGTSEPIGKLRGRVHRYHGIPLVVTASPAYLLRHPEGKADAWEDLCLALESVKDSSSG